MTRLLVTGASGQLGAYLLEALARRRRDVVAWSGSRSGMRVGYPLVPVDLADANALSPLFSAARPDVVVHAAALSSMAECVQRPASAERINSDATGQIAGLCAASKARLIYVSTDLVFDGNAGPYRETDTPSPQSVYGRSKLVGEERALACPDAVVVRLSLLYGPSRIGVPTFFDQQRTALVQGTPIRLFADEWRTPLDLPTAAEAIVHLLDSRETGVFHLGGPERMSRLDMGRRLARLLGLAERSLLAGLRHEVPASEPRPRDTSLDSTRFRHTFPQLTWPTYEDALTRMLRPIS